MKSGNVKSISAFPLNMMFKTKTKKKKKEMPKTVKSIYWYWKGSDIFGEGRKTIEQKTFENK